MTIYIIDNIIVIKMRSYIKRLSEKVVPILREYGVKRASLFGSCVRGRMRRDSDIDILVKLQEDVGLLDFIKIKLALEEVLGREVDLVEYCTIKPLIKRRILSEQVAIL